jgi:predicted nucleic acid-binding protein
MLVVDANIVFPLVVRMPQSHDVRELFSIDPEWRADPFILIELSNILATYERIADLPRKEILPILANADSLLRSNFLSISNEEALDTAMDFKITSYDARYLAVAIRSRTPLITEDKRLRKAAPDHTISLADALKAFK